MTPEEFLRRKEYIKDIYLRALQIVSEEYAVANNKTKVGDAMVPESEEEVPE